MGMLADERGQDFHDRRMVLGGVARYSLQDVDAADPHIKLVGPELLDRLGAAVGHLPFPWQREVPRGSHRLQCPVIGPRVRQAGLPCMDGDCAMPVRAATDGAELLMM